jgi:hypothetical protein
MQTGLLPAADLRCCGANRDAFDRVDLGDGRAALLRPQQMPDHRLLPTLAGVFAGRPELWRRYVDRHVFFWAAARRRDAFSRACIRLRGTGGPLPVVLAFDTAALLEWHGAIAFFATINIGSTVRGGARVRRDENTLRPVADYCRTGDPRTRRACLCRSVHCRGTRAPHAQHPARIVRAVSAEIGLRQR